MRRTLVLDCGLLPIKIVCWQKAMTLLVSNRAEIVDEYHEVDIRTPLEKYKLPKILRLYKKHRCPKRVPFNRYNVFYRDQFTCQYCYIQLPAKNLTLDHVVPRSKGGPSSWENVVACCHPCNRKKDDLLVRQAGMRLRRTPRPPQWAPYFAIKLRKNDPDDWLDWIQGPRRRAS